MRRCARPKVIQSRAATQPSSPSLGFQDHIPESLASFAEVPFGTDLEQVIIAHDKETQAILDQYKISWGTQYELARGVTSGTWKWEEVKSKVKDLSGDNAHAAWKVQSIMRGKPVTSTNPSESYLWYVLNHHS